MAPVDVRRVETALSNNQVAAIQVQELNARNQQPKVVVADSLYGSHLFLADFLLVKTMVGLVRVRGNSVFCERPKPRQPGQRGAVQTLRPFPPGRSQRNFSAGAANGGTDGLAWFPLEDVAGTGGAGPARASFCASRVPHVTNARCGCFGPARRA